MASVTVSIQLPSFAEFQRLCLQAVATKLNDVMTRSVSDIETDTKEQVRILLWASPQTASLLNGDMWHVMGLISPQATLTSIINAVADSVVVTNLGVQLQSQTIRGRMTIGIVKRDYASLLSLPAAAFTSENNLPVPWLSWLLQGGTGTVLADYNYLGLRTGGRVFSRTGQGIMIKSRRGFSVPSESAGTAGDNWILRALAPIGTVLPGIIAKGLERTFR